ncbi:SCP2 sterol-binding domain-containing protein [Streptomyces synnematoformans]|uniref:SCP2 domain-containing protein n=1 Tax=Streptomyces synnematoformans TaxID=415721 RepID=A0ABN2XI58_9ACTN
MSKVQFLTPEFFTEVEKRGQLLPEREKINITVQYVIRDTPVGDEVRYYFRIVRGRIEEARLGDADTPTFTISAAYKNSVRVQQGKLHPSAGFMTGRLRASGNIGKLMSMLPLMQSGEFQGLMAELRTITEY